MPRDSRLEQYRVLHKLRSREKELAEQKFAHSSHIEKQMSELLKKEQYILEKEEEQAIIAQQNGQGECLQDFSLWLPLGRRRIEYAEKQYNQAFDRKSEAHAELIAALARLEAIKKLITQRENENSQKKIKQEQKFLDEIALRQCSKL